MSFKRSIATVVLVGAMGGLSACGSSGGKTGAAATVPTSAPSPSVTSPGSAPTTAVPVNVSSSSAASPSSAAPGAAPVAAPLDPGKVTLAFADVPATVAAGQQGQISLDVTNNGAALPKVAVYFAPQWGTSGLQAQVGTGDWQPVSTAAYTPQLMIPLPAGQTVIHYRGVLSALFNASEATNPFNAFAGVPGTSVFALVQTHVKVVQGTPAPTTAPQPGPTVKFTTTGKNGDFTIVYSNPSGAPVHVATALGIDYSELDGTAYLQGDGCWTRLTTAYTPIDVNADGSAFVQSNEPLPAFDLAPGESRTIHGMVTAGSLYSSTDVTLIGQFSYPHVKVSIGTAAPSPVCG